ncbi:MAG: hypothetical protein IPF82_16325 [Blastocatellia bacterium]|nr:hypothetical protein [Blastocatellia bacterium]
MNGLDALARDPERESRVAHHGEPASLVAEVPEREPHELYRVRRGHEHRELCLDPSAQCSKTVYPWP